MAYVRWQIASKYIIWIVVCNSKKKKKLTEREKHEKRIEKHEKEKKMSQHVIFNAKYRSSFGEMNCDEILIVVFMYVMVFN